jgi:hypothetical protein
MITTPLLAALLAARAAGLGGASSSSSQGGAFGQGGASNDASGSFVQSGALGQAGASNISNVLPRVDAATGAILDIHDGTTIKVGDTVWWYGASYGGCREQADGCASLDVGACGFQLNHTVSAAFSTDLATWTLVRDVLPVAARPAGILFSPWVAFSPATQKYVMWFNILPVADGKGQFDAAYYAVATADAPGGPFETVRANITGLAYSRLPDAPSIFVDDDGSGYVAFTHEDSHVNSVQQLTPDLLGPLPGGGVSAVIGAGNNEGVFMFKRGGTYYVGFGRCCCVRLTRTTLRPAHCTRNCDLNEPNPTLRTPHVP